MRHRDRRERRPGEQLLEPEDRVHVEVVRGLVEEQQVGPAHELARERDALLPASPESVATGVSGVRPSVASESRAMNSSAAKPASHSSSPPCAAAAPSSTASRIVAPSRKTGIWDR